MGLPDSALANAPDWTRVQPGAATLSLPLDGPLVLLSSADFSSPKTASSPRRGRAEGVAAGLAGDRYVNIEGITRKFLTCY